MPVDPSDGERFAGRVYPVVVDAETALLRLIAAAIADDTDGSGGLDNPDAVQWAQAKLARLRFLQAQVDAGAATLVADLEALAVQLVREAYDVGAGLALADLDAAPAGAVPAAAVQAAEGVAASGLAGVGATRNLEGVRLVSSRVRAMRSLITGELSAVYRRAVEQAAVEVVGGAVTRRAAAQHVLDRLGSEGVSGFTDQAGRRWRLESYAEMAVRTAVGQAAVDGHTATLQAAGLDLVMVSDVPRECPLCRPFEGKVLTLSGVTGAVIVPDAVTGARVRVRVHSTLEEARSRGFQHPNCRHRLGVYLPGATRRPERTEEPEGYEAGQRQRAMERKVREWKRREAVALDSRERARARAKVRAWQAAIREHVDANGLKRLSAREQIGQAI